jgi:hypothetical protein
VPPRGVAKVVPAPASSLSQIVDALEANGYGPHLRPCPPPAEPCWFTNPRTKQPEQRPSDGKVPGQFRDGAWYGLRRWREYAPTPADFAEWKKWSTANLCVVTGEIVALDLDVKIDDGDRSTEAATARKLVGEIKQAVAAAFGVEADALPLRWRSGTTSCVIFARMAERTGKRKIQFGSANRSTHAVEFLADGQQVVIAGTHQSGSRVHSSLPDMPLTDLPLIDAGQVDNLMVTIGGIAARLGFQVLTATRPSSRSHSASSPDQVVLREVLARRDRWLPSALPVSAGGDSEIRVPSADLDRDLEEDLAIFPDGIHDYGTERGHTPSSLIAEFGAIDDAGEIVFGGAPEYGRLDDQPYAVVGEPDPTVRRPTEAQALTWLCRVLSGWDDFPALPEGATWKTALPAAARSIGLNFDSLTAARWFEFEAVGEDPTAWDAVRAVANGDYLAALQVVDPSKFGRLAFALELAGVDAVAIAQARREVVAETAVASTAPQTEQPPTADSSASEFPEPFDIFGHVDVGDLGVLPRDCLPPILQRWVTSEARRKGAPEPFAAVAAVGVAASAIGASQKLQVRARDTGFIQPASLWFALVADPGSGKSPTISAALRPLRVIDEKWYSADKRQHDAWTAQASKRKDAPDRGPEPIIRRLLVDDVTLERQVQIHAQNPRGLLRAPDELAAFLGSFGQYKKNGDADRGQALRLFDGGAIKVDRVSGGAAGVYAKQALMGVLAGTQPERLRTKVRELGADGMLQRFLFVVHDGVDRDGIDEPPDAEADEAFAAALRLLTAGDPLLEPVRLSVQAQALVDNEIQQIRALKHLPGTPSAWGGHVEKWGMFLPRLVLTFHCLELAYVGRMELGVVISPETALRAIRFGRFLLRHSLHVYLTYFETDRTADDAQVIAGFVLTHPDEKTVTHRTIGQWRRDMRGDENLRRRLGAMNILVTAGWLTVAEQGSNGPAKWSVNPAVHVRFKEHADRELREHQAKREKIRCAGAARAALTSEDFQQEEWNQ